MIISPYVKDEGLDPITRRIILGVQDNIENTEEDYLLPIVGPTGTGKSILSLQLLEIYDPNGCSIDSIGLDRGDFATAIKYAKEQDDRRACVFDEANVNSSDHMTGFNKDILDLYWAIRGLKIFHIWNNPSAVKFPKEFIEERMKGLIFITDKSKVKPRQFYYFTKTGLLKVFDECKGKLTNRNLKKYSKQYAFHKGWFRNYEGRLLSDYKNKKLARMDYKVENFFDKYGRDDLLNASQVAKQFGVSHVTIANWHDKLGGMLVLDEDYTVNTAGQKRYLPSGVEKLKEFGPNDRFKITGLANKASININARKEKINDVDLSLTKRGFYSD